MSTLEPERGAGTGTLVEPTPQVSNGDGDHERYAHYVQKDKIMASALEGTPVVALCGKVWVPGRDPKKYPVCPMCKEIYESMAPAATRTRARAARTRSNGHRYGPQLKVRETPGAHIREPRGSFACRCTGCSARSRSGAEVVQTTCRRPRADLLSCLLCRTKRALHMLQR